MAGSKQSFEKRFARLIQMLDLMSETDGVRRDSLKEAISVPERTMDRDIKLLNKLFTITKTNDSDGARRFYFDKCQFNLDSIKKSSDIKQIRDEGK